MADHIDGLWLRVRMVIDHAHQMFDRFDRKPLLDWDEVMTALEIEFDASAEGDISPELIAMAKAILEQEREHGHPAPLHLEETHLKFGK